MVTYPKAKQGPEAVYTAKLYAAIKAAGPDGIGMDALVQATGRPAKALLGLIGNMRGRWGRATRRTMVYSVKVFGNFARYFDADVDPAHAATVCERIGAEMKAESIAKEKARKAEWTARVSAERKAARDKLRAEYEAQRATMPRIVVEVKPRPQPEPRPKAKPSEHQKRLTAANNRIAERYRGTVSPTSFAPKPPKPAAVVDIPEHLIFRAPAKPDRWAALQPAGVISRRIGEYEGEPSPHVAALLERAA